MPPPRFSHRDIMHMLSGTMLGMFLGALDQTIIATSLPTMVGELHGMEHMSWAVSAYLLTSTAATPIYGKLSDLYGRRLLFGSAIFLFLLGSVGAGLAQNMGELIAGRAVQGIGGGGLISLAMAIVADIVPPRERARYQAYFSGVWTVATLGGPVLGGFLVDVLDWRWVFWINLPIGAAALLVCNSALKRLPVYGRTKKIDYLGAGILIPAIVSVLLVTTWAGTDMAWNSPTILALIVAAVVLTLLFAWQEHRADDPIVPPRLLRENVVFIGVWLGFFGGAASVGATIFLPLFLQVVVGASASNSGMLILPMMIGITVGALGAGRIIRWTGRYKLVALGGLGLAALSFALFMTVTRDTPTWLYASYMGLLGIGLGPCGPMVGISVQNAVHRRDLGTATSLTNLFRSMGASFGVALLGAVLLAGLGSPTSSLNRGTLLHGGIAAIAALSDAERAPIIANFGHAFIYLYIAAAALAVAGMIFALFWKEIPLRSAADHAAQLAEAAALSERR